MMEVKKALRKISIENSEKIGEGFYGTIYRLDPETPIKITAVDLSCPSCTVKKSSQEKNCMHFVISFKELRYQYRLILLKDAQEDLKMNLHITLRFH